MINWKKITAGALSICMLATYAPCLAEVGGLLQPPVTVYAETNDIIITGAAGSKATWNYNRTTNIMTISGTGNVSSIRGDEKYRKEVKKIVFSDQITKIGSGVFQNYTALEEIEFGGVKVIQSSAFAGCTALKNLNFNGNLTRIRNRTFKGCTSLKSVNLGENLKLIGTEAFRGCTNLTTVTVGSKVKTVEPDIFKGCNNLTSINLSKKNTYLYADGNKLLPSKLSGTCGKNVKYSYNAKTKTLTLSGSGAMENGIHFTGDDETDPDSYYSSILLSHYEIIQHNMETLIVGDKITSIGTCAFSQCDALKTVKLGKNVSTIGSYAFIECTALKTIQSGNNIKAIGKRAFSQCSKLNKICTFTNLTNIGSYSFYGCKTLKTFSIGKSVKSIGEGAFCECANLRKFSIHKNNKYFSKRDNMLLNKSQSKIVSACFGSNKTCNIYNSVKEIDNTILSDSSVKSFAVRKKNTKYSSKGGLLYSKNGKTLEKCPSAKSGVVNVGDSVTKIASDAFLICDNITKINIGENVKTISLDPRYISAKKLNSIQISDKNAYYYEANGSVISKANEELLYCYKIDGDTYTVPDSVKKIGDYAFSTQKNLKTLILSDSVEQTSGDSFLSFEYELSDRVPIEKIHLGKKYYDSTNEFDDLFNIYGFKEVSVSSENPYYTSVDGVLYNKKVTKLLFIPVAIETFTIPDSVTGTKNDFYFYGTKLKYLTISDTITDATNWLFPTESLHIGKNVNTIFVGEYTNTSAIRRSLYKLKSISVDEENNTFKAVNNMLYSKDGSTLVLCPAQTKGKVVLEDGVTEISEYAFQWCDYVTDIVIPDTVSKIEDNAFYDLNSIVIWVPKGKKDFYKSLFTKKTGFTNHMIIMELEN